MISNVCHGAAFRDQVPALSGVRDSPGRVWNEIAQKQVRVCMKLYRGGRGGRSLHFRENYLKKKNPKPLEMMTGEGKDLDVAVKTRSVAAFQTGDIHRDRTAA